MRYLQFLFFLNILLISCNTSSVNNDSNLLASFGDQPSVAKNSDNNIVLTFGQEKSIFYVNSKDEGESFSEPVLVAKLEGLVLGHSSGPKIASTSDYTVIAAPSKDGNLFAWSKKNDIEEWEGPFRINDLDKSAGESLASITATPDGKIFCVWIDTRFIESDNHAMNHKSKPKDHSKKKTGKQKEDLNEMTPMGITKGALYEKIGGMPEGGHLAFHSGENEKLYWVILDVKNEVLKAESYDEYKKFKERNGKRIKVKGKIYLSYSEDGGKKWSKSKLLYKSPEGSVCECCKPSIKSDSKGNLIVMFRNNLNGSRDLHIMKSTDGGKSFSLPEKMGSGTWEINGCPMDGGDLTFDNQSDFKTIWQRKGTIFIANSSTREQQIAKGRSPSISSNIHDSYIVYSNGKDIMATTLNNKQELKIGSGSFPKVIALNNGSIYFWVNEKGINYKKNI